MVKKWITRVLVLGIVLFVMFKTKGFFDDLKDGTYAHEIVPIMEAQSKNNSSKKENKGSDTPASVEEPVESVPEKVYEPSDKTGDDFYLDLSYVKMWESGEYDEATGEKVEHRRRMRTPDLITIECAKYNINISEGYKLRICEYSADEALIRSKEFVDEDVFEPSREGEYFSVTLIKIGNENSLSPGQWGRLFESGIEVIICTDKWQGYSGEVEGSLIEGRSVNHSDADFVSLLLSDRDDELSELIWNEQIANEIYTLSADELNNDRTTYYVSSSEGNDDNPGLSRDTPKKSLDFFSGMSNVNVLLKCGDSFDVSNEMKIGSNCIYAAYGSGSRPKINFYRAFDVKFVPSKGISNVWEADFSDFFYKENYTDEDKKTGCNIGQLRVDGIVNWKRFVWSSKEEYNPHVIEKRGDGAWAVDWKTATLYYYSETDPNDLRIEYAPPIRGLFCNGVKNIVIKGLDITGVGGHCINLVNCENVAINCCYIHDIGGSVQSSSGMRYGNAIQVWNSGKNIDITNNYSARIFDTCYTNQGSDKESELEHVHFVNNIGTHFYWGIEAWGEAYTEKPFNDVTYTGNILYDNVDITNPHTRMHVNSRAKLLGTQDNEYISYRTGYKFHQMSAINMTNAGTGQITKIENNVVWNTNRFLVFASNSRKEKHFSALMNNLLHADNVLKGGRLMRFNTDGQKLYCEGPDYLDASNKWSVHFEGEEYDNTSDISTLDKTMRAIMGME